MALRHPIAMIQRFWEVPSEGMTSIGKMRATTMPLIMTEATLLKTARTPRCSLLRVERGTIRLWDMLYMV